MSETRSTRICRALFRRPSATMDVSSMSEDRDIRSVSADTTALGITIRDLSPPRIAAAVIAGPALAMRSRPSHFRHEIAVPALAWPDDSDEIVPHPNYTQAVLTRLWIDLGKMSYRFGGHFTFLAPCTPPRWRPWCRRSATIPSTSTAQRSVRREFDPAVVT